MEEKDAELVVSEKDAFLAGFAITLVAEIGLILESLLK